MQNVLRVQLLSNLGRVPTKGSSDAAGFDLYSAVATTIPAKTRVLVKTDIAIAVPAGCYGRVASRSGLSVKHGIEVGAGVIDKDYTGNVGVILYNHSDQDFDIKIGDRIAQLILEKIVYALVLKVDDVGDSARGGSGFGSTGV